MSLQSDVSMSMGPMSLDASITGGVGTYLYASPEQLRGGEYDCSTDMWSLGIMAFELSYPSFSTAMERTIVSLIITLSLLLSTLLLHCYCDCR